MWCGTTTRQEKAQAMSIRRHKELIDKSHYKEAINAKLDTLKPAQESKPKEKESDENEKESKTKKSKDSKESTPATQEQILQPIDILRF